MSPHFEITLDAEGPNPLQVGMDRVRSGVLGFCSFWVGLLGSSHGVSNPELRSVGVGEMKFNLFESADLSTFAPLTVNPDSVSVVEGSICLELAPEDRAAFFRFNVE